MQLSALPWVLARGHGPLSKLCTARALCVAAGFRVVEQIGHSHPKIVHGWERNVHELWRRYDKVAAGLAFLE